MKKRILLALLFATTFNLILATPSLAIPSPDVVVGLFASAAQVLVLLTAVLGGLGFSRSRNKNLLSQKNSASSKTQKTLLSVVAILLVISLGANALQFAREAEIRNNRLQANLVRSSIERGEKVGDTSLKTLSFSEQMEDPKGIQTEDLAKYLEHPEKYNIIDVREPEEKEMGKLKQADYIQYPEIFNNPKKALKKGKETVLFCYSGNRSGELCQILDMNGYPCKFVVGGYEKWIAEGYPIEQTKERKELREIPDYPNKKVLLDTPDVQRLVQKEKAIFVDVRYPGDFELGHLPKAYNIPTRKLTKEQSDEMMNKLPKRPVIAACYDKRSCFYALIMGLRLSRAGYDYRGRYTVPHEYVEVKADREYIEQWNETHDQSFFGKLSFPLTNLLQSLYKTTGNLALAIVITVFLLRLLIVPLTFKGERDQLVLKDLAPVSQELKEKYGNDRRRYSQAILKLYREHKLTPTFNLLGTFAQIIVFILLFRVVSQFVKFNEGSFLWLSSLGKADPYYILPILIAGLTILTLQLNANEPKKINQWLLHLGAGIFLFVLTFNLAGGVNLYLTSSLILMLIQRQIIAQYLQKQPLSHSTNFKPISPTQVIPLNFADRVSGTGNKAARLAELMKVGFPVPMGFVIPSPILAQSKTRIELSPKHWQEINRLWRKFQLDKVAVRSSGAFEDGKDHSFAGMFTSVLNVSWEGFYDALQAVYDSQNSQRVNIYQEEQGNIQLTGGILIQKMVKAEYSGVFFTQHPSEKNSLLIELISGLAEDLVSGKVTPKAFSFGKITKQLLSEDNPPIDLTPLIEMGQRIEKHFGYPQDIEWSYAKGQFFILQSRNITSLARLEASNHHQEPTLEQLFEQEKQRLLSLVAQANPDEVVFIQNELSELLPQPTPLSLSLMEAMWENGGTTDLACQNLGLPYDVSEDTPHLITTIFGSLYVNLVEQKRHRYLNPNFVSTFRLIREIDRLEEGYYENFLPYFFKQIRLKEALNFSNFKTSELFDLFEDWKTHFIEQTYVQAQMINIAAEFSLKLAERELKQRNMNPVNYLSQISATVVHKAMLLLPDIQAGNVPLSEFLELFGHRSLYDFELAQPRYNEDYRLVQMLVKNASANGYMNENQAPPLPNSKILQVTIDRARKFQTLKEEAKHQSLREFALIRRLLLELSQRLELGDHIFYFRLSEISQLQNPEFRQTGSDRKHYYQQKLEIFNQLNLSSQLTQKDIEALNLTKPTVNRTKQGVALQKLQGTLVAGKVPIEGRVQIITNDQDIHQFTPGHILVTRFTHPSWTPIFPKAKGVVTEIGGWLSHAAIVAREYNIPSIVGVQGALNNLVTGDWIRFNEDGTIDKIEAKSRTPSQTPPQKTELTVQSSELTVQKAELIVSSQEEFGTKLEQEELVSEVSAEIETDSIPQIKFISYSDAKYLKGGDR